MRYLYSALFYLALPFLFIRLWWRSLRQPVYRQRLGERIGFTPVTFKSCMWVHAVSVGESIAAIPLIKLLQNRYPDLPMVVTTMTPTGGERIKTALGETVTHLYIPYDLPGAMHRFLRRINPVIGIIMETELWPNLIAACQQRQIPVCLVNARLSAKSAAGYQRIASLSRAMLQQLTFIATHGHADAERFLALGADPKKLIVTGSIKFDLELPASLPAKIAELKASLGSRPSWVAASTHEGEEEIILAAHQKIREQHPQALLILVPRHPNRFDTTAKLAAQGFTVARRSLQQAVTAETAVYLGDTMGELLLLYGAADISFVGGSLIQRGGHNILEPAALGKPIVTGESSFNFAEITALFIAENALIKVADADSLAKKISWLMQEEAACKQMGARALDVMAKNRGALAKQVNMACEVMNTRMGVVA